MGDSVQDGVSCGLTHGVTQLLDAVRQDEPGARDRLIELVFGELHRLARRQLAHDAANRTLQPTALVNEAWMRLFGNLGAETATETAAADTGQTPVPRCQFENRRHFFAAAAQAMHRICVDYARKRRSAMRGGGVAPAKLIQEPPVFDRDPLQVLAVDEALKALAERAPELVEVVRLRYFVDLSLDDTAKVLGVSRRTIAYRWRLARALLVDALRDFDGAADGE